MVTRTFCSLLLPFLSQDSISRSSKEEMEKDPISTLSVVIFFAFHSSYKTYKGCANSPKILSQFQTILKSQSFQHSLTILSILHQCTMAQTMKIRYALKTHHKNQDIINFWSNRQEISLHRTIEIMSTSSFSKPNTFR